MNKIELLEKIQRLAVQGYGGEAENAADILSRLMKKYGIEEKELDSEKETDCFFKYRDIWERKLLNQIAYSVTGRICYRAYRPDTGRPVNKLCVKCTKAQEIEINAAFEFYRVHLAQDMQTFYNAFLVKNDIFYNGEKEPEANAKEPDFDEAMKILQMTAGMEKHERLLALPK